MLIRKIYEIMRFPKQIKCSACWKGTPFQKIWEDCTRSGNRGGLQDMDLKLLRLYQITKFLSDFPQESLEAEDADFMKLLFAPLVLAGQPSEKWIEKLDTPDRASYWAEFSRHFYWIAKCWVSSNTLQSDPLRPLLKAGLISRNKYNIIWLSQKMFERLWTVCQHTEPFVREVFEQAGLEYPFPNAGSLFAQVVGEMANEI